MTVRLFGGLLLASSLVAYGLIQQQVQTLPREEDDGLLRVAMPGPLLVIYQGGDRHLAANVNVFRSMMVGGEVRDPATYEIQAKLQRQASILNPYHEDNYYIAAAILSWEGQVDAARFVLERATEYRGWDFLAPFFAGFNAFYFDKDGISAGRFANLAADRLRGGQAQSMRDMAAKWYGTADDLSEGIRMLEAMAQSTPDPRMKNRILQRKARVEQLLTLRKAADQFRNRFGRAPDSFEAMLEAGVLDDMPEDPMRQGYTIDDNGQPQFKSNRAKTPS